MHAVVNRIRLARPIPDEVFASAAREVMPRVEAIEGLRAMHLVSAGEHELVVVLLADSPEALERTRVEVGNAWMRENVVPYAAGAPERVTGEVVASFERA